MCDIGNVWDINIEMCRAYRVSMDIRVSETYVRAEFHDGAHICWGVETDAGKGQSKRRRQVPWRCLWKQWKQRQNGQKPLESRWEAIGKPLDILVSCMMSRILNVAMFVHYCSLTYEFHGTSKCRGISLSLWKRGFWWGIWRTSRQGGHGTGMPCRKGKAPRSPRASKRPLEPATNHDESWRIMTNRRLRSWNATPKTSTRWKNKRLHWLHAPKMFKRCRGGGCLDGAFGWGPGGTGSACQRWDMMGHSWHSIFHHFSQFFTIFHHFHLCAWMEMETSGPFHNFQHVPTIGHRSTWAKCCLPKGNH